MTLKICDSVAHYLKMYPEADDKSGLAVSYLGAMEVVLRAMVEAQRWRKWPDEKPEKEGQYLISDDGRVYSCSFIPDIDCDWTANTEPQAWMPLPKPAETT